MSASDFAPSNKKQIGLGLDMNGGSTVITGDFNHADSAKKDLSKKQQFTKFMEKLVQTLVAPKQRNSKAQPVRVDENEGPRDGGPLLDGSINRRTEPKVQNIVNPVFEAS